MSDGLAKAAPAETNRTTVENKNKSVYSTTTLPNTVAWEAVPIDIYHFFSVDIGMVEPKVINKLREITEWAMADLEEKTIGNVLSKLQTIKTRLGVPNIGEKQYDKIWHYARISSQIKDLEKRREALRGW